MMNVAVIGTGNIAPNHIEGLLEFPDRCRITALVDIYPEKAEAMKKRFGLDCQVFDSHEKLLASDVPFDLVHVCTPPYVHAPIAVDMMDAGKNVVVEKPMAASLEECDRMNEAEKRNGVVMACIAQNRFRDSIYKLKKTLEGGKAGKLRVAHVNSLWWRGHCYYDLWWRGLWEKEGGGPTLNHAVHHIDMINWIQGELPTEVTAVLGNVMHDNSEVEDVSFATLRYKDGSMAQVTSSVVHHGEEQGLVLQCEKAKIEAPWDTYASKSLQNGFPERNEALEKELNTDYEAMPNLEYEGHTGEIADILNALEKGTRPLITGEDGRKTVELISAIYKSGCRKETVTLPLGKDDDFYTFQGILDNAVRFYKKTSNVENFAAEEITVGNYKDK